MRDPLPIQPFTSEARGRVQLPGSKSITNRALPMAALSDGAVTLKNPTFSRDSALMLEGLVALGFDVESLPEENKITITGQGGRIPHGAAKFAVGNAGTMARFLTALLVHHPAGTFHLDGDPPMRERPMKGLLEALTQLGGHFTFDQKEWHFPFTLHTKGWTGDVVKVDPSASSQMLTALLLSAARAPSPVRIQFPATRPAFVQLTIDMMERAGIRVDGSLESGELVVHPGPYVFGNGLYPIEPDASAASYFIALPAATGGLVELEGYNNTLMQGDSRFVSVINLIGIAAEYGEGHTTFQKTGTARGPLDIDFETFSDTFLTLAAISPLLPHPVMIRGIGHTRHQETDRIHAATTELRRLHQEVEEGPDWLRITPRLDALRALARSGGATIDTYEDHRVAMSFGILGSADICNNGQPWMKIKDPACCGKTFPRFFDTLEALRRQSLKRISAS